MTIEDRPVGDRQAVTYAEIRAIVTHPAFRLGFLDAQAARPFDHDAIMDRIARETPVGALKRLGFDGGLFDKPGTALAQYRYEEGRRLFSEFGVRCRAWGHPDYPPAAVRRFIEARTVSADEAST